MKSVLQHSYAHEPHAQEQKITFFSKLVAGLSQTCLLLQVRHECRKKNNWKSKTYKNLWLVTSKIFFQYFWTNFLAMRILFLNFFL